MVDSRGSSQREQMTLTPGNTVRDTHGASYVVEGLLGKGGFGAVYVVRDRRIRNNLFALKELIGHDKLDRECFIFEGELLKRLDHRALPHVYRVFEHEKHQHVYMLMDYIKGRSLADLRKEQPEQRFAFPVILVMLAPIFDALIYLHSQDPPIVHRDIKPANIIIPAEGGEAVLVDFGTAKEYDSEATTTVIRHASPGYAAPEQYMGGTNPRTDIYGIGATLYTLLTGQIPPDALVRATRSQGVDPLNVANSITPGVPMAVAGLIQRAMSLCSDDRFQTVEEFWLQLQVLAPQQQEQALQIAAEGASQSLPLPVPNQGVATAAAVQRRQPASHLGKRFALPLVLLVLLLTAAMGTGFTMYTTRDDHTSSVVQRKIPLSHPGVKSQSTLIPRASIYPAIAASYAGTVVDLLAQEKTSMVLTHIQQSQGSFRGYFQGLGFVGPFKGSVTPSGHVQFVVAVRSGESTISFEGDIKVGGDIVGSFEVLLGEGQPTGESGLWNVASGP